MTTSPEPSAADTPWHRHAHARDWAARCSTLAMLSNSVWAARSCGDHRRADLIDKHHSKVLACCTGAMVMRDRSTGQIVSVPGHCNSRICPTCSRRRADTIRDRVAEVSRDLDSPRLITLTIRTAPGVPLADAIRHLRESFKRLRQQKAWKSHIRGGITVMEITRNAQTGAWHPHLHILADGVYWRQADLSQCWEVASGGSRIVDIRMIRSRKAAAEYVSKYVGKHPVRDQWPDSAAVEWVMAMAGQRVCQTFGCCHGRRLTREKVERPLGCEHLASLAAIWHDATHGDIRAQRIQRGLRWLAKNNGGLPASGPATVAPPRIDRFAGRIRRWVEGRQNKGLSNAARRHSIRPPTRNPDHRTLWSGQVPDPPTARFGMVDICA